MGVSSSPGHAAQPTASRSIDFYFGAGLIGPITCLLALWGVVSGIVLSGALDRLGWLSSTAPGQRALIGTTVIAGTGLIVVLAAAIMMGRFARRLSGETSRLAATARHLADERLPRAVEAMRGGQETPADTASQL